jgi:mitogen-activated protein kinase kinase
MAELSKILKEMLKAMQHYFSRGIVHRDIKPDNVMLGDDGMVRICDFGVSFKCENNSHLTKQVGSMMYMAPEIFEEHYD